MIGPDDHIINPRSGRPEPNSSWQGETVRFWLAWFLSGVSLIGAAYDYYRWRKFDTFDLQLVAAAGLFAALALWRQRAVSRKRAALKDAVTAYEAMLDRAR